MPRLVVTIRRSSVKHPDQPGHVTVPHPRKDLPEGTLRNIFSPAGWVWK